MNNSRRESLRTASAYLDEAADLLSNAKDDEWDAMNNLPEGIRDGERGEAMEEAFYNLDDAVNSIRDAQESIELAIA